MLNWGLFWQLVLEYSCFFVLLWSLDVPTEHSNTINGTILLVIFSVNRFALKSEQTISMTMQAANEKCGMQMGDLLGFLSLDK